MPFVDWTQILAYGAVSSSISALFALISWKIAGNAIKRRIWASVNAYVVAQINYFQQNPKEFLQIVQPFLGALAEDATKEAAGGENISLGPFNKYVPKILRPLVIQKAAEFLQNMQPAGSTTAKVAKTVAEGFK